MKGLEEYIKKHGRHFTRELAQDICGRYSTEDILGYLQKKVYYNVSGFTTGDIVYLFNALAENPDCTKNNCRDMVIRSLGNVENNDCMLFSSWASSRQYRNLDLSLYI